ncbi:glycosyltransferase [Pseudooceanicola sp. CBS1P-1]|uniref:Glycosyltransferase n=1 Tax=Pseudooceanicola albus TaxID=2692189 RepID=A0A6L7G942_9RHOB|nr:MULTISPECIES: glycosyltransferase [Pseudooceanicola]MBT9383025.1 glycosyltransferase [Pseudooceanicola endophyticus]MXN19213.1 glycosyltransferase [Pseudooceanicola albus]
MDDYFRAFEDRRPPEPLPYNPWREALWQFCAVIALVVGAWYIDWRWTSSLNYDALWFAIPLALAETCAYIGLILFVYNLWRDQPVVIPEAPVKISDVDSRAPDPDRPIAVDVMFATYNEDPELVRLGIHDARAMEYPHPIDIRIHVLDDGRRPEMRRVAQEEGVGYITRTTNEGFKAGNLRNAMEQTHGDFIVICDADTRVFPTLLARTMGYFRDQKMAWVQTPQWFYDLPEGETLTERLSRSLGGAGRITGRLIEGVAGEIRIGADPFVNEPKMFYDVILRRRNRANAAFCCGAASIHRREAVMEAALRAFGDAVEKRVIAAEEEITLESRETKVSPELLEAIRTEAVSEVVLTPYRFHVSEDIYTSIVLHSDRERGWKSYQHPYVESKMLSPQDMLTWTIQRFKYAGGSLDIMFNDNALFRPGMTLRQRMMYAATFYSYLGPLWNVIFLFSPAFYLFTGLAPVSAYSNEFFVHIIPFLFMLELAMMIGTWGVAGYTAKASYLSFFPLGLKAIWTVVKGEKISFVVTPKARNAQNHLGLVKPQLAVLVLTALGVIYGFTALTVGGTSHTVTGVVTNALWGLNNCVAMAGMIRAATWQPPQSSEEGDSQ